MQTVFNYDYGNVTIQVKKIDDEWTAVYIADGERDEAKTYYAGGSDREHKEDAIEVAKYTIKCLKVKDLLTDNQ